MNDIKNRYKVTVLGGGPAGLAAAISAKKEGADVLLIERESRIGGILKQCIHDGFGLLYFGERLTGPEYAQRFIDEFRELDIDCLTSCFVTEAQKNNGIFTLTMQSADGIIEIETETIVIACGCRERTSRQVFIHGERPAGIINAGTAQYLVNIMGKMPAKRCVILGSGDIGLIMARRLTLEGAEVLGVYEVKNTPSGLARNISQCLNDYNIPLHLSTTVTRVFGKKRVEAVEVAKVDERFNPIEGTSEIIECDTLILSVGLIPENEISESLGVKIDSATKGAFVDQNLMTTVPGVFSCGNALHVNDLVDHVTESGIIAGKAAAHYGKKETSLLKINYDKSKFLYAVPQYFDRNSNGGIELCFRARDTFKDVKVILKEDGEDKKSRKYKTLAPTESQVFKLNFANELIDEIYLGME